jgi:surface antigen
VHRNSTNKERNTKMKRKLMVVSLAVLVSLILTTVVGSPAAYAENKYPSCNCTWYAQERRQDLPHFDYWSGYALNWGSSARANGFRTGSVPEVGAIVVFQPGVPGVGGYGHVAYVEQVYSSSSYRISEMGWGSWPCSVNYRTAYTGTGVEFIYRGGAAPSGYVLCASENQRCSFSGTRDVAYGANGRFSYRYGVSNGIDCNNATFGDPISGVFKACYTKVSGGMPAYTFCATENGRCSFSGTHDVAYGANGRYTYRFGVVNGIDCNNAAFGDPVPGAVKTCYLR